jgi:hypothetical protein
MAGGISCTYPTDFPSFTSFRLQVNSSTNSIYSNLYLSLPPIAMGVAELITAKPDGAFWLSGTSQEGCNRHSQLAQVVSNAKYGVTIALNSSGRDALKTTPEFDQTNWTSGFYIDAAASPFSLDMANSFGLTTVDAGSYYGILRVFPRNSNSC